MTVGCRRTARRAVVAAVAIFVSACSSTPTVPSTGDALFDACYRALATGDAGPQPPASVQVIAIWKCTSTTAAANAPIMFLRAAGDIGPLANQLLAPHPTSTDPSSSVCAANEGLPQQFLVRTSDSVDYTLARAGAGSCGGWRPNIEWLISADFQVVAQYTPSASPG